MTGRCDVHIWGGPDDGLRCVREAGHPGGHVYTDSHGSHVDDRHTSGGHG